MGKNRENLPTPGGRDPIGGQAHFMFQIGGVAAVTVVTAVSGENPLPAAVGVGFIGAVNSGIELYRAIVDKK